MRRTVFLGLAVVFAVVALCPSATAQITKSGSGYLLRMKWTKGDKYQYSMTMSTQLAGSPAPSFMTDYSMFVDKVVGGVADVVVTSTAPGSGKPSTQTVKMDGRGAVGDGATVNGLSTPRLPAKAIRFGDSWTASQPTGTQNMKVDSTYVFKAIEKVNGVECAVLDVKATGTGSLASTSTGKIYLMTKNGQAYKMDLVVNVKLGTGAKQKTAMSTISIQLK